MEAFLYINLLFSASLTVCDYTVSMTCLLSVIFLSHHYLSFILFSAFLVPPRSSVERIDAITQLPHPASDDIPCSLGLKER